MADMQELYTALQKADAAGDAVSAKQLADYIRSLDGQPRQTPGRLDTFVNALPKGAAGFADSLINTPENVLNLGKMAFGTAATAAGRPDLAPDVKAPPTRVANAARSVGVIRDSAEPTDATGRIIDMVGQTFGGGGINPSQVVKNVAAGRLLPLARDVAAATASGLGAGVGSEYADNFKTGNESADTAIKAALTMIGGAAPSTLIASRGTAGDRAAAAMSGVTPQQVKLAEALMAKANQSGTPVTAYEAVQAVTGLNPKMQTQQRVVEQSDAAATRLTPMMQARPGANAAMFEKTANGIAPAEPFPDVLAGQLQKAAQESIDSARTAGNAAAAPFYARSSNDPNVKIPPSDWNNIASDPRIAAALEAVKRDPFSGLQNAQAGSVQWLDAAKKWLDGQSSKEAQAGNRYAASTKGGAATAITGAIDPVVPDYAKARGIVAQNMKQVVEPMEASQVGKLARSDDFRQQVGTLLPEAPLDVNPSVVARTASTIGAQNPDILARTLAQYLRGTFSEANQSNTGGQNAFGGAKFAAKVAGNPMQEENLVQALKSAGAKPDALQDALAIFRAQGMKPPVNSATTANAAEAAKMGGIVNLLARPVTAAPQMVDNWRNGWATKALAEALSDPAGLKMISELARQNGTYSPTQQQLMVNLLNANRGN